MRALRSLVLAVASLLAASVTAAAQVTVPKDFFALDLGASEITAGWPNIATATVRPWDCTANSTQFCNYWATAEPTQNSYSTAPLDTVMAAAQAHGADVWITLGGSWNGALPSWISSMPTGGDTEPCLGTSQRRQAFYDYATAMFAHWRSLGVVPKYLETWNEHSVRGLTWTCADLATATADMAAIHETIYAAAKAAGVVVATPPSFIQGAISNDPVSNPTPGTQLYVVDQLWQQFAGGYADAITFHGYQQNIANTANDNVLKTDPSGIVNTITAVKAMMAKDGYSSLPLIDGEYFLGEFTSGTLSFNSDYMAGSNCFGLLAQSALGVQKAIWYAWKDQVSADAGPSPRATAYSVSGDRGLNKTGQALRQCAGWVQGATWTTPFARNAGTDLLGLDMSTSTTGKLGGPGGCAGAPAGNGSLPNGVSINVGHSTYISAYVVGVGASGGVPYADIRLCGTDQTASSGYAYTTLSFAGKTALAWTQGQSGNFSFYDAMPSGGWTGVSNIEPIIIEYNASQASVGQTTFVGHFPMNTALSAQSFDGRFVGENAAIAAVVPALLWEQFWNSAAPYAMDVTLRVGAPRLDGGSQWSGVLQGADGVSRCVVMEQASTSTYTPSGACAGYGWYRDQYGVARAISGSIALQKYQPVLIEAAPAKYLF